MSQAGHIITKIEYGDRDINNYYLLDALDAFDVEEGNPYYEIEAIEDLIIEFDYTDMYKRIKDNYGKFRHYFVETHKDTVDELYNYVDDLLYLRDYVKEHDSVTLEVW